MVKKAFGSQGNAISHKMYLGHCLHWELCEKVTTFISGRDKACYLACFNSDLNVGKSSKVALPTKDMLLFWYWFPQVFGSKGYGMVVNAFLGINCFLFYLLPFKEFQCVRSFSCFVYLSVYLYLQMLESYPFDFHWFWQGINKRFFEQRLLFIPDGIQHM